MEEPTPPVQPNQPPTPPVNEQPGEGFLGIPQNTDPSQRTLEPFGSSRLNTEPPPFANQAPLKNPSENKPVDSLFSRFNQARRNREKPGSTTASSKSLPGKAQEIKNTVKDVKEVGTAAGSALAGNYLPAAKLAAKKAAEAIKDPKEALKKAAALWEKATPTGRIIGFARKHKEIVLMALVFPISVIIFVIFYSLNITGKGDTQKIIGVPDYLNYTGDYCEQMTPNIEASGQKLVIPDMKGKFSVEDPAKPPGLLDTPSVPKTNNDPLTFQSYRINGRSESGFTSDELKYYITGRWNYAMWYFSGKPSVHGVKNFEDLKKAFAGKKVIIYNPAKNENNAVVGIIAESGPAPWAGTAGGRDDKQQADLWNQGSIGGARFSAPEGYTGRVAGGPPELAKAIGADEKTPIIVGFAKDQNLTPGTAMSCKKISLLTPSAKEASDKQSTVVDGESVHLTPFPAVWEGRNGQCGVTSTTASILWYNSSFTTQQPSFFSKTSNPIVLNKSISGDNQSLVGLLNQYAHPPGQKGGGWVKARARNDGPSGLPQASKAAILSSLRGSDPVVLYTRSGGISRKSQHIVVITGYNPDNGGVFTIQNPGISYSKSTSTADDGSALTWERIVEYAGEKQAGYHQTFLIKSKYL